MASSSDLSAGDSSHHGHPPAHDRGAMPVKAQAGTYRLFNEMVHWGATGVAALVSFLTIWLCAHAGFFPALIVAVVIVAAGVAFAKQQDHIGPGAK